MNTLRFRLDRRRLRPGPKSDIRELNEDFDVVRFSLQGAREVFGLDTAADEPLASQERSARARNSPAIYQCRLLAFTLPTITLFFNTAAAAISAPAPK